MLSGKVPESRDISLSSTRRWVPAARHKPSAVGADSDDKLLVCLGGEHDRGGPARPGTEVPQPDGIIGTTRDEPVVVPTEDDWLHCRLEGLRISARVSAHEVPEESRITDAPGRHKPSTVGTERRRAGCPTQLQPPSRTAFRAQVPQPRRGAFTWHRDQPAAVRTEIDSDEWELVWPKADAAGVGERPTQRCLRGGNRRFLLVLSDPDRLHR